MYVPYTVQLDRTCVQHGLDTTGFSFYTHGKHACECKTDDIKHIVQRSCVCINSVHDSLQMHPCMSETYTPN